MDISPTAGTPDLSLFKIYSRAEILSIMNGLFEKKQLLRMMINQGTESIVTSILDVNSSDDTVVLDTSADSGLNQRFLEATPIRFETVLDNISINFEASDVELLQFDERPAFSMALPSSAVRLQRREFYRVETPFLNPVHCVIQIPDANGRTRKSLPLQNVSGGGVGIIDESNALEPAIGTIFEDCRIELPNSTFLIVKLQIRNIREVKLANGRTVRRLGCLFVDLPRPMLATVQRYISQLERERSARKAIFE